MVTGLFEHAANLILTPTGYEHDLRKRGYTPYCVVLKDARPA